MRESHKKSYHFIYFLLQPFFTLIYYLKNFRKPEAKNVMWLFTIFFGFTFAIGVESKGSDILSYMGDIPFLHTLDLNFSGILAYYFSSREVDVLRIFLAYVVSSFTANGFYLLIVYGAIFGYFYSRNMWYILDRLKGRLKFFPRILVICLFFVIPIWALNGFRFWTASHVFIYGLLPFLFEGKKKSLVWCLITPFIIHFSFLVLFVPLGAYLLFGNKVKLYYIFFVLSLFFSAINITKFNHLVESIAPQSFVERSASYRSEKNVESLRLKTGRFETNEKEAWYSRFAGEIQKYTISIFLLVFYWTFRKTLKTNKQLLRLLSFILLFYGFANFLSNIPSGGRFIAIANVLTFSFLALYFQNKKINRDLYRLSNFSLPFLIFFILLGFRMSWYSFSLMTLIGNPITAIFTFGENISLNDIIKGL